MKSLSQAREWNNRLQVKDGRINPTDDPTGELPLAYTQKIKAYRWLKFIGV